MPITTEWAPAANACPICSASRYRPLGDHRHRQRAGEPGHQRQARSCCRLSRECRRQFGAPPSQDAARLHGITRADVPAVV
ncbi:hypothetical protein [Micromonospora sp. NPDC005161]